MSNRVVVRLAGPATQATVDSVAKRAGGRIARLRPADASGPGDIAVLQVPQGSAAAAVGKLAGDHRVAWAEPDRLMRIADLPSSPNDPCYQNQPTCTGTPNQVNQDDFRLVNAPAAWAITHGNSKLVVAVLDTVVDTSHVDLQGKVDTGQPFVSDPTPPPCDDAQAINHGTHVTGTIAANTDNGVGVAGLGWDTRVLAIQVLDNCGIGLSSDIADGIREAVAAGARVINMSLTGDASNDMGAAVAAAEAQGVVMVAAAGNDGSAALTYPAAFPGVLGVAATNQQDQLAPFSNRGLWVPLAGPGVNIWSTVPGNRVGRDDGSSMAAPHVSAAAALVLAIAPDFSGGEVAADIERTAARIAATGSGVRYGRVDLGAAVSAASHRPPPGYRLVATDGGVFAFGGLPFQGSAGGTPLNRPVVAAASSPDGLGYWLAAADGGIFSYGDAQFLGSTGGIRLNQPIVAMAATRTGEGYWLVARDGGIFTFGDAGFYGSTGETRLNKPIVGMAATPTGLGYWLVSSDGGIFSFGDAAFFGSTGNLQLKKPIVGMASTRSGLGYWLVASDGGVFAFGDATFFGSTGDIVLNKPIVAMDRTATGMGYWLVAADGGIFTFGDAAFFGSTGDIVLNQPIIAAA